MDTKSGALLVLILTLAQTSFAQPIRLMVRDKEAKMQLLYTKDKTDKELTFQAIDQNKCIIIAAFVFDEYITRYYKVHDQTDISTLTQQFKSTSYQIYIIDKKSAENCISEDHEFFPSELKPI